MRNFRWLIIAILLVVAIWRLIPELSSLPSVIKYGAKIQLPWVAVAIISQTGQYLGSGWLSQVLLKIAGFRINFKNTFLISALNVFAAHILPVGDAGMIAATFYFYKKLGVPPPSIIFLAIVWPIFGGIVLISLFATSIFYLPKTPNLSFHPSIVTITSITVAATFAIILFSKRQLILRKIIFLDFLNF